VKQPYAGSSVSGPVPIPREWRAFTAKLRQMREDRMDIISDVIITEAVALIRRLLRDMNAAKARNAYQQMMLILPTDLRTEVFYRFRKAPLQLGLKGQPS